MQNHPDMETSFASPEEDATDEYVSGEEYREQLQQLAPAAPSVGWRQKAAIVVLALFGVSAVVLWGAQFKNNLGRRDPLPRQAEAGAAAGTEEARLRGQDTDQDGLSDYEELQFYKTSPYIQDTDSDGASDFEELQAGDDPNCPEGTQCAATDDENADADEVPPAAAPSVVAPARESNTNPSASQNADVAALEAILSGQGDAGELRALLIEAGMNRETLDAFSDEQLVSVYQDALKQYQQQ